VLLLLLLLLLVVVCQQAARACPTAQHVPGNKQLESSTQVHPPVFLSYCAGQLATLPLTQPIN
jgi:hypothetical protein